MAPSILDRMIAYHWPGNARELRNTIERAVILCPDGSPLDAGHLPVKSVKSVKIHPHIFRAFLILLILLKLKVMIRKRARARGL